ITVMANCPIKVAHNAFLNLLLHHSSSVFSGLSVVTSLHLQLYAVGGTYFAITSMWRLMFFKARQCMQSERRNTAKYGMTAAKS
ncbi:hypothetical protein ACJEMC_24405, partial [Escherichia coli]